MPIPLLALLEKRINSFKYPWIILLHTSAEKYAFANGDVTRLLTNKLGYRGIYVSLNKPYESVSAHLFEK